jgi:predicted dehydrogenase
MKALIVGLGSIGTRHGRNLAAAGVALVGFDPDPARRDAFGRRFAGAPARERLQDALDEGCEIGVVASPNRYHLEQSLHLASAGMHLLIEKPLAADSNGLMPLVRSVQERKLVAMVGSNWKFHPILSRMHRMLIGGDIGRPLAVQALGGQYLPDWHPNEDYRQMYSSRRELGGGALLDSHDIDYLTWLLGTVASVSCRAATTGTLDIDTEDLACMTLQFRSGALGTLQLDYLQHPYGRRVHITGESGTLSWDAIENELAHYSRPEKAWQCWKPPLSYDLNQMYVDELEHFLGCVRDRSTPVTPLQQGLHVMAVIDAARRSSQKGGAAEPVQP